MAGHAAHRMATTYGATAEDVEKLLAKVGFTKAVPKKAAALARARIGGVLPERLPSPKRALVRS